MPTKTPPYPTKAEPPSTDVGWLRINGGPWAEVDQQEVENDFETVRSNQVIMEPDLAWQFVDGYGHVHMWAATFQKPGAFGLPREDRTPTLRKVHRMEPCDGSCGGVCEGEGIPVTDYFCTACGETVKPGWREVPGPHERSIQTGRRYHFSLVPTAMPFAAGEPALVAHLNRPEAVSIEVRAGAGTEESPLLHMFGWGFLTGHAENNQPGSGRWTVRVKDCTLWSAA